MLTFHQSLSGRPEMTPLVWQVRNLMSARNGNHDLSFHQAAKVRFHGRQHRERSVYLQGKG